jgi:hypothetical protein
LSLSINTIKAQQSLSEKFGIPTFNLSGGISTIPVTGRVTAINVGTGQFFNETTASLTTKLNQLRDTVKGTGGQLFNTFFTAPEFAPATGDIPGRTFPSNTSLDSASGATGTDKIIDSLTQFKTFLGPIGLLVIGGIVILSIMKRGS